MWLITYNNNRTGVKANLSHINNSLQMPNQSSSPTKVNEGYSGISGSFSLCGARKKIIKGDGM